MFACLILTPWMAPHQVIPWEKAISQEYTSEIDVLERYDEAARSPSVTIRFPAVARLSGWLSHTRTDIKFSRATIYQRDRYTCQYCGARPGAKGLNYDHVVPRCRGGETTFENIVCSCHACNLRKGSKTLRQAGMVLRKLPVKPRLLPMAGSPIPLPKTVPELWLPYLTDRLATMRQESA
jgi:5-methylcytosine-specific restriction endonuclease McrA